MTKDEEMAVRKNFYGALEAMRIEKSVDDPWRSLFERIAALDDMAANGLAMETCGERPEHQRCPA